MGCIYRKWHRMQGSTFTLLTSVEDNRVRVHRTMSGHEREPDRFLGLDYTFLKESQGKNWVWKYYDIK